MPVKSVLTLLDEMHCKFTAHDRSRDSGLLNAPKMGTSVKRHLCMIVSPWPSRLPISATICMMVGSVRVVLQCGGGDG